MENLSVFLSSPWLDVVKSVIATCSVVAAITPNKFDNQLIQFVRDVIDAAAFNFGGAVNAKRK